MKKFLLMFAAVAAIAFVGCKPAEEQKANDEAKTEEIQEPAAPTVETVTADLMKLVEAKDEAGAVAFLDGLKKTAEEFLTKNDNNGYFNIINIIKTVWEANKDKIGELLPALKDKMEAYITPKAELKDAFDAFIADPANKLAEKVEGAAEDVANKANEVKEDVKAGANEVANDVKEVVNN